MDEPSRRWRALGAWLAGCASLVVVLAVRLQAERSGTFTVAARGPAERDTKIAVTRLEEAAPVAREAVAAPVTESLTPQAHSGELERTLAELARALAAPDYDARRFESAARALAASLPPAELDRLGSVGTDPSSGGLCAVQGVLARVAPRPLGERRALAAPLLHRLRGCIDDESVPTPQRAQMGAVLAALGEPADRARWIEAFSAPARPDDRIVARTALVAVEGPGAGAELVESARRHARSDAGAELLAVVGSWARDHAAALPPDELDACSTLLESIAADEATGSVSRTRALSALRVLDAPRASARALQWLADPQTDPARFASACLGVRDGDVDADRAAALLGDPALSEARRMDVATALAARANGERETDAARTRAVDTALELLAHSADPEVRRRAASLAGTATRPEDRSSCARLASSDPDAGVRAAARSALARAERRRPRRRGVRLREPRRRSSRSSG